MNRCGLEKIYKTKKEGVQDLLKVFTKKGKLEKYTDTDGEKNPTYTVKNVEVFHMLLNDDFSDEDSDHSSDKDSAL